MAWRAVPLSSNSIVLAAMACGSSKGTSAPRLSSRSSMAWKYGVEMMRLARAERVRECSGNNLAHVLIGRDVDIRGADQFNQLGGLNETVAKDDAVLNAELLRHILQGGAGTFHPRAAAHADE